MKKWLFVGVSGLLVGFSFPTVLFGFQLPDLGFLGWIGLVPLFILILEATPWRAAAYAFVAALIFYAISFYWIVVALHSYGHLSLPISVGVMLLLSAAMALYPAAACGLARWLAGNNGERLWIFLPLCWTILEWTRNYTPFNGFPWSHIAMSQANYTWLTQISDITGVWGVIFLVVLMNATAAKIWRDGWRSGLKNFFTLATAAVLILTLSYGAWRTHAVERQAATAPHIKVGLIQPNIPQDEKWELGLVERNQKVFSEAVGSLEKSVDLIIWPETSLDKILSGSEIAFYPQEMGVTLPNENRPYSLIGAVTAQFRNNHEAHFNSAVLLNAAGAILGRYHKVHLVPFGEYIPLENIFSFLKPLAVIGDFAPGSGAEPIELENTKLAPLICYEDIFPELTRAMVRKGAGLLVNMTNDAWYGLSSAAHQHLALAQFRAAETKRAMVRATNTGVTAVIEPTGRVAVATPLFERGVIVFQTPILSETTLYTRFGNWFVAACVLAVALAAGILCRKKSAKI